jgi:hypothetical protein
MKKNISRCSPKKISLIKQIACREKECSAGGRVSARLVVVQPFPVRALTFLHDQRA